MGPSKLQRRITNVLLFVYVLYFTVTLAIVVGVAMRKLTLPERVLLGLVSGVFVTPLVGIALKSVFGKPEPPRGSSRNTSRTYKPLREELGMSKYTLGRLELDVLLAIHNSGSRGHGGHVQRVLKDVTGSNHNEGSIYTTLQRLEDKGLLASSEGPTEPGRRGVPTRRYQLLPAGVQALEGALAAIDKLRAWRFGDAPGGL